MSALEVAGQVLAVLGSLVLLTAAVGVVRFPDAYTRISAVGTASGAGIVLVVLGALLIAPSTSAALKALGVVVLQLATSAVGSMAIARAARLTRTPMVTTFDELAAQEAPDEGTELTARTGSPSRAP
ncbi:cation:proton antiporter [Litorihabitans aurantiacus]|uniref:Monovalent cation/H(+) antiporter subunit G n=1 Tax=Litorihabitans aurantiacus TaxID=1930061 RepID=A0AA38CWD1_9MICO|nr:monovalent cation/H(+) antiporter subunit G [Litorihabitans aurantiacus]GMA32997.1 hypothetical protein GCM10025875_29890 [Litorihabitans aurantiacus]